MVDFQSNLLGSCCAVRHIWLVAHWRNSPSVPMGTPRVHHLNSTNQKSLRNLGIERHLTYLLLNFVIVSSVPMVTKLLMISIDRSINAGISGSSSSSKPLST